MEITHDHFDPRDLQIQDGCVKINMILSPKMVVECAKFEVDMLNTFGENIKENFEDLFDLSDLEIQDGRLKINRILSPSLGPCMSSSWA